MSNTVKEVTLSKRGLRMVKKTKQELNTIAADYSQIELRLLAHVAAAKFELQRRATNTRATNA